MKLSDYVADFLSNLGIGRVFMVIGGANAHLADSLAKHPRLQYVCCQHEQAAAMAAEGYARVSGGFGAVLTTSGPGGTNAITGLGCSWCDSVPVIFISGQVSVPMTTSGEAVRQLGVQQINIASIAKPMAKYAVMVREAEEIGYHLEKAVWMAKAGRPGPVWIDIPTNLQHSEIEPAELRRFTPRASEFGIDKKPPRLNQVVSLLKEAERPVIIAGYGIRIAGAQQKFLQLLDALGFPVITTWNGIDLVGENHPLYVGCSGVFGQRGANFAVANCDLVLSIGSRLDTRQIGDLPKAFARAAKKIVVDVDRHELEKGLINIDLPIVSDASAFLDGLLPLLRDFKGRDVSGWIRRCRDWKEKYPVVLPEYFKEKNGVNSYVFIDALCEELRGDDIVVTDMGTSLTGTMQAFKVKNGQRLFTNTGFAPMGFGLPASIGAWFASGGERIICLHGDGGLQMNIQELQTVVHYAIPLKLFVLNNNSYLTIKHTQRAFFGGRIVGSDASSGYSVPDFVKIGKAYGLATSKIRAGVGLRRKIRRVLERPGPVLCEIIMPEDQPLIPRVMFSFRDGKFIPNPIENMFPELSAKEFSENMLIPPYGGEGEVSRGGE